jgi:NADH-quinone oxidoreductase subunit B
MSDHEQSGFVPYDPQAEQQSLEAETEGIRNTQTLIEKAIRWFHARSMFVVAYGTGCGAIEMPPVFTSRYDIERLGVVGVATPRQADILIVSGYASLKTLRRIIRTYEQMSEPKYVIALGSCTINGGMYWDSYNTIKRLEDYIGVDMYVAGCMPRPEAIIEGFVKLQAAIRDNTLRPGYVRYRENLAGYKANQTKVLGERIAPEYEENYAGMELS